MMSLMVYARPVSRFRALNWVGFWTPLAGKKTHPFTLSFVLLDEPMLLKVDQFMEAPGWGWTHDLLSRLLLVQERLQYYDGCVRKATSLSEIV